MSFTNTLAIGAVVILVAFLERSSVLASAVSTDEESPKWKE
jgi:hypothetical protein